MVVLTDAITDNGSVEPAAAEEAALWADFKDKGNWRARERLFAYHETFARNIARRHFRERARGDLELADILQLAFTGLLEALDRFDPTYGAPFRAFAARRISGSIRDGIVHMSEMREQMAWRRRVRHERMKSLTDGSADRSADRAPVEQLAEIAMSLALGFMLEGTGLFADDEDDMPNPPSTAYDSLAWKETVTRLHVELSTLPDREQTILRQHYATGLNFDQLASLLAISKGRVSQLHRAALHLLRKRMREQGHFRMIR